MKLFEPGSLWSYRGYRFFWFSNSIFVLGASAFPIALAVAVLDAGGTATSLGLILGARILSGVVFAPFAGVWADRLPRKNVMIGSDLFRSALVVSMVFVSTPTMPHFLLGLAVFINYLGMPRSAPLVGGLVLALMTFPVVIIASRASLQSVPPSIRDAALGVGASKIQTIFDHILPLALPGILTGSIIGMARALGESAPLIMIGMVAFVVDIPSSPLDSSAALPVQVYLWADSPERGFVEKTSAAIMVLLTFLLLMNSLAIWLRNKYEIKW